MKTEDFFLVAMLVFLYSLYLIFKPNKDEKPRPDVAPRQPLRYHKKDGKYYRVASTGYGLQVKIDATALDSVPANAEVIEIRE